MAIKIVTIVVIANRLKCRMRVAMYTGRCVSVYVCMCMCVCVYVCVCRCRHASNDNVEQRNDLCILSCYHRFYLGYRENAKQRKGLHPVACSIQLAIFWVIYIEKSWKQREIGK